ncbi:MAG: undecaprenyl-diphosphate phosphatase [Kiritimatiellae bacterium]|nr:undecaprenyl-diphosphate phosphatase [Kiritimatiellia bacterium]
MNVDLNLWQSLALAAIQGATEFLPVSSSGHLVLARRLFGWSDAGGLLFDTVLHGGSLAAILIYFWREWVSVFHAYFSKIANGVNCHPRQLKFENRNLKIESVAGTYYRRLPWLIIAATIPAVLAGPVLKPWLENDATARNAWVTGMSMIMTALLFLLAERRLAPSGRNITFRNAIFVGCLQVVALLPGASRSGWTAAGGIFSGQSRENAVRFAFFMAVPAIAGAIVFQGREILAAPQTGFDPVFILSGFLMSFAASFGAIHFCLKFFRFNTLRPFAVYLMAVGIIALLIG